MPRCGHVGLYFEAGEYRSASVIDAGMVVQVNVETLEEIDSEEFRAFLEEIKNRYDYDFTDYAESSLLRRTKHFMEARNIFELEALSGMLRKDEGVFEEFVQGLSVTVTEMFRDPSFYKVLRDVVMKRLATYPFIKIWLAGCATGEEVYSMAILLKEENLLERTLIYATDINQRSLDIARLGTYSVREMKTFTANYFASGGTQEFSEYYQSKYNAVSFDKNLRRNVVFSAHNLTSDKSFNEFELIICRNVIMYFNQNLQTRVLNLFDESLCHFGFLGLGDKESLLFSDLTHRYEAVSKKEKIYMKIK